MFTGIEITPNTARTRKALKDFNPEPHGNSALRITAFGNDLKAVEETVTKICRDKLGMFYSNVRAYYNDQPLKSEA